MKKSALALFCSRTRNVDGTSKQAVKAAIRNLADNDECFENVVFELGCSVLAKEYQKTADK